MGGAPGTFDRVLLPLDRLQRRSPVSAFVVGVGKKFLEDRAGQLAALVAYYSFFSIFPLLLALVTILRFVLSGNEHLQREILDSALAQFPVIGDDLSRNVGSIQGDPVALVIGLAGAVWGGLRAMTAAQTAMDDVWDVPFVHRPNFLFSRLRGLAVMGLLAAGLVGSIVVTNVAAVVDEIPGAGRLALQVGSIGLNVAVLAAAYLVLTDAPLRVRQVLPGATLAGVAYWLLQLAGSAIVRRRVAGAEGADGTFAIVIGLLTWLWLVAQVTLVAAEVNVVWCRHLWPRSLSGKDLTEPDVRAFASYARQAERTTVLNVRLVARRPAGGEPVGDGGEDGNGAGDGAVSPRSGTQRERGAPTE
jgi:YihY family inner membrane protein